MEKLLKLLSSNARLTARQLAVMLDMDEKDVEAVLATLEKDGVIRGYTTVIDWEKTSREYVTAIIEIKVTPKRDYGFDEIAEKIMSFPEVESLYLMSGGYDLSVTVSGKTFKDIALFVSQRLSTLDSVLSTATYFVLKRYKEGGVSLYDINEDFRRDTMQ